MIADTPASPVGLAGMRVCAVVIAPLPCMSFAHLSNRTRKCENRTTALRPSDPSATLPAGRRRSVVARPGVEARGTSVPRAFLLVQNRRGSVTKHDLLIAAITIWTFATAVLVMFMQAGFASLEAGLGRMENTRPNAR